MDARNKMNLGGEFGTPVGPFILSKGASVAPAITVDIDPELIGSSEAECKIAIDAVVLLPDGRAQCSSIPVMSLSLKGKTQFLGHAALKYEQEVLPSFTGGAVHLLRRPRYACARLEP